MTNPTGGLRKRLIRQNLFDMIDDSLRSLGWYDAGRQHLPINFVSEPVGSEDVIPLNTLALADENESETDWELGSDLAQHTWVFYLDFFGEKDSLGLHLSGDLHDILKGVIPSIGRTSPSFAVYDVSLATPPLLFYCDFDRIVRDKAINWTKPHQQHWYSLRFEVLDYYGSAG